MRTHPLVLVFVLACSLGSVLTASPARANGEDRALALDLFAEGRALFKSGDYAAALTRFEAAGNVMRTFGILLNIAECQEKLGRTASAWATWREARAVASEGRKAEDEAMAVDKEKALEPKLVRLTLIVPSSVDAPQLEIRRDGVVVPRAAWSGVPIDPGAHVIEERAPGRRPRKIDVFVRPDGAGTTVTMTALEADPSAPRRAMRPDTGSAQRAAGWLLAGFGLAATGAGIAIAVAGQGKHDEAVATDLNGNMFLAQSEEASANTMKLAGYATLGGGGAFLVSGGILLLTLRSSSSSNGSAVFLAPWLSPASKGCSLSTTW